MATDRCLIVVRTTGVCVGFFCRTWRGAVAIGEVTSEVGMRGGGEIGRISLAAGSVYRSIENRSTGSWTSFPYAYVIIVIIVICRYCCTGKRPQRTFLPVPADAAVRSHAFNNTVYTRPACPPRNNDRGNVYGFACDPDGGERATATTLSVSAPHPAAAVRRGRIRLVDFDTSFGSFPVGSLYPDSRPGQKLKKNVRGRTFRAVKVSETLASQPPPRGERGNSQVAPENGGAFNNNNCHMGT